MENRILLIDGQVFQTPAWDRGMGKYSLELLNSISEKNYNSKKWKKIIIILSSKMPLDKDIMKRISAAVKDSCFIELELDKNIIGDKNIAKKNKAKIEYYIKKTYKNTQIIDYMILSLMQGEVCSTFPNNAATKILLFYDLIPLVFHKVYLQNPITRMEYLSKIKELLRADVFLTISKTVANDLIRHLGIDSKKVYNIDGGAIDHGDGSIKYPIEKPFILMPTGNDLRKNNRRGILGFEAFNNANENRFKLIITSYFKDFEIEEYKKLSNNIIFTGNILGEELNYLYSQTEALLFPSEYEGLGLPILEAMKFKKPIACSDISVFKEISEKAFYYFDPYSVAEICDALTSAIKNKVVDNDVYRDILSKYSWRNTSDMFFEAIDRYEKELNIENKNKSKIEKSAVFAPDPATSYLGRLIQLNHTEFSKIVDVDYFLTMPTQTEKRINYLPYISNVKQIEKGMEFNYKTYRNVVYHISNLEACSEILFTALAIPGIVVIYDLSLEKVWKAMLEKKLITQQRFDYETSLNDKQYQSMPYSYSLFLNAKTIFVCDTSVREIFKNRSIFTKIKTTTLPVNIAKYPIGLISPNVIVGVLTQQIPNNIDILDDLEYEALAKDSGVLEVTQNEELCEISLCISYGLIPVLKQSTKYLTLKGKVLISKQKNVINENGIVSLLSESRQFSKTSTNGNFALNITEELS